MNKFLKMFFVFFLLISSTDIWSQNNQEFPKIKYFNGLKPVIGLDANRSYFLGQTVRVYGIRAGVKIKEKYRVGLGFYNSDYVRLPDLITVDYTFLRKTKYRHTHVFFEYVWLNTYKWTGEVGFGLGSARAEVFSKRTDNLLDSTSISPRTGLFKWYGSIEYKIWPFLGVSPGVGYVFLRTDKNSEVEQRVSEAFSATFYDLNVLVHISELYKFFFQKDVYKAEREEYIKSRKK